MLTFNLLIYFPFDFKYTVSALWLIILKKE